MEGASDYVDETRVKAIGDTVQKRINALFDMSIKYVISENISTDNDVEENIVESYGSKMK